MIFRDNDDPLTFNDVAPLLVLVALFALLEVGLYLSTCPC